MQLTPNTISQSSLSVPPVQMTRSHTAPRASEAFQSRDRSPYPNLNLATRACTFDDRTALDASYTCNNMTGHRTMETRQVPRANTIRDSEDEGSTGISPLKHGDGNQHANSDQQAQSFVLDTKQPTTSTPRYLSVCSVVVEHPKRGWVELCCSLCGANCTPNPPRFMNGVRGIARHLLHKHKSSFEGPTEFVLEKCVLRELKEDEVENIQKEFQAGNQPIPFRYDTRQVETVTEQRKHNTYPSNGQYPRESEVDSVLGDTIDTLHNGKESGPVISRKKAAATQGGAMPDTTYSLKPFQMLEDWPTVVLREDGTWVELRCPECGTNVSQNDQFIKGAYGFARHLELVHPESVDHDEFPKGRITTLKSRWAVQRCSTWGNAEWSLEDIRSRRRNVVKIKEPAVISQPKRIVKTAGIKRARSPSVGDQKGLVEAGCFAGICPCTLSGHRCGAEICDLIQLCLVSIYVSSCSNNRSI
jgi:hypothetical protein